MRVLYGISGGIAAYKAPEVVRALQARGHEVRCVLTAAGGHLVSAAALAALTRQPVADRLWTVDGSMPHIHLARWCELMLIAPATADCLARCALGLADDLLTTLVLALENDRPLLFVPAMNTVMWQKSVVQEHVVRLRSGGARILEPVAGSLACGEEGVGAMADPQSIAAAVG